MVDLFIPEQGFDKNLSDNYYDIAKTGTLDVLGASFQETLYYNPANALSRTIEQYVGPGTQGKILSKDEWSNSDYYRDGIEVGEDGIKEGLAQLFAERVDKRRSFQNVLQRSRGGFGLGAAQFGVALAGSLLDPLNIASGFIPSVALARSATLAAKYGTRGKKFTTGLVDGAVGAAVLEPLIIGQAYAEQDKDYTLMDSFLNVALGGVISGGLHYGIGKMSDRVNKIKPTTREKIHGTAVGQALGDSEIQVSKLAEEAQTVKTKKAAKETDEIIVYNSKGEPKLVEKVSQDPDGRITIKDEDGNEKLLDSSDVFSKSIYDDDYEITTLMLIDEATDPTEKFSISGILSEPNSEKLISDAQVTLDLNILQLEEAKKNIPTQYGTLKKKLKKKEIDKRTKSIDENIETIKKDKNALEIALKKAKGEDVQRPKDPIKQRVTEKGESDLQTASEQVEVKEGEELNPEQISNTKDSTKIESKLGRLSEYEQKVKDIKNDTAEYNGQTLEEINEENLSLQEELEDENIIADLPEESKKYIASLKAEIKAADELVVKAETVYEKAVTAGANCVIRTKS